MSSLEDWGVGTKTPSVVRERSSCDKKFRDSLALTASDDQVDVEAKHEDDRDHVPRPNSVDSGAQKDESWRTNGASKSVWSHRSPETWDGEPNSL